MTRSSVVEEKKKYDEVPKKLTMPSVFGAPAKQPEFPVRKAGEAPKKLGANPFDKKEETVIQSSKPVEAPVKKIEPPT